MHANSAQAIVAHRLPFSSGTPERSGPWRRDHVDLGSIRVDRIGDHSLPALSETRGCVIVFQTAASACLWDRGNPMQLWAGKWSVGTTSSLHVELPRGSEAISLVFPLETLSRNLASQVRSHRPIALPMTGASKMCLELSRSCLSQQEPMNRNVAVALGECLGELAKLAIIEHLCVKRGESVRETVRTRIQSFVQRNLHDPELTIDRIAERMDCTKRYLHKVFSNEGQTLNQYIWAQRLERCRSELVRADIAGKSITEIAFECGFSNAAHFSRSFRSRFGQAPRVYRRAALEG